VVLGVETFTECEELFTMGRWLLSPPLVETATCVLLERHPGLTQVRYSGGYHHDEDALLETVLGGHPPAAVYLCLPTTTDGQRLAQQIHTYWPHVPIVRIGDTVGTCLACAPLIGLQLSAAASRPGTALLISRWWDAGSVLWWPAAEENASESSERKDT
jgi:hypothetical protein